MRGSMRLQVVVGVQAALVMALAFGGWGAESAFAAGPPRLGWTPVTSSSTYDFGTVDVGSSARQAFTLANTGGTASAALSAALSGSPAFEIVADGCTGVSIGPRKRCSVTVEFTPTSAGVSASATLVAGGRKPDAWASLSLLGAASETEAFDGEVAPVLVPAAAVSQVIGPDGGSIVAGGITLTVPAGALHGDQTITLTPVTAIDGSPLPDVIGALDMQPEGLHFLTPAILTIPRPAGLLDSEIVGFGYSAGGTGFHLAPSRLSAEEIVLRVLHFSGHGAARASLTEVNRTLGYEPTPAQERADQEIAAAEFQANQDGSDPTPRIKAALLYWFDHSVATGLAVVGDSLDNLELALGEWVAWKSQVDYYQLAEDVDVAARLTAGAAKATEDAAHIADLALSTCTGAGADPFAPIQLALRLRSDLTVVPLPIETLQTAAGRQLPTVLGLVEACMRVRIEGTSHPPVLAFGRSNIYTADAGVVFWNSAAPNHAIPLVFTLFDETANQPLMGPTEITNGHVETTITPSSTGNHDLHLTVDLAAAADNELLRGLADERHEFIDVRARIDLAADANPVQSGATTIIRIRTAGDGMAGAAVTLTTSSGSLAASSVITDAQGNAVVGYTAPNDGTTSASITADFGDAQDLLPLTISQPIPVITISPTTATVSTGATRQFVATVTNVSNTAVTWAASGGTISSTGLYTAGTTPGTYTVSATTVATPQQTATATVTITGGNVTVTSWVQLASASAAASASGLNEPGSQDGQFVQDPFNGTLGTDTSSAAASASATGSGGAAASGSAQSSITTTVSVTNGRLAISGAFSAAANSSQTQGSAYDPQWGVYVTMDARGEASALSILTIEFTVSSQAITFSCSGSGAFRVRNSLGVEVLPTFGTATLQPGTYRLNWAGHAGAISSPPGIFDGAPDAASASGSLACS